MENVWEYLRANKLCSLVWDSYKAIIAACKAAWEFLIQDPDRIRSIGRREWACVDVQAGWYYPSYRNKTQRLRSSQTCSLCRGR